jgi:hypothetical protein
MRYQLFRYAVIGATVLTVVALLFGLGVALNCVGGCS